MPDINALPTNTSGADEYGGNGNPNNYITDNGSVNAIWYVTWDDIYIYFCISNANITEPAIIYLDVDPIDVVNGGSNVNGNISGQPHYGLTPDLPFRADAHIYVDNNTRELYEADGSGGWTLVHPSGDNGLNPTGTDDETDGDLAQTDNGNGNDIDDDREFRVRWDDLTNGNGRPSQFLWTGYIAYTNGLYAQVPIDNPSGTFSNGATPNLDHYLTVSSTTNGSSTNPTSQTSYSHLDGNQTIGTKGVFDFTLNDGSTIDRTGPWDIAGKFIVAYGTVESSGTLADTIGVNGHTKILSGGELSLPSGSGSVGGDLVVGDSFIVDGTFNCNNRAVVFDGNGGKNFQTITGNPPSGSIGIDYFRHKNPSDIEIVDANVTINDTLDFFFQGYGGKLFIQNGILTLAPAAMYDDHSSSRYSITNDGGSFQKNGIQSSGGNFEYPIGTASGYNPVLATNNSSNFINVRFSVCDSVRSNGQCSTGSAYTSEVVNRTWRYFTTIPANLEVQLQWDAGHELSGFNNSNSAINRYYNQSWNLSTGFNSAQNPTGSQYTRTITGLGDQYDTLSISSTNLNNLLPLTYLSFNAQEKEGAAKLHWQITDAFNVSHFDIQHSTDGKNFQSIGSEIFGYNKTDYYFSHQFPHRGTNYYRIKSVDDDGQVQYSPVRAVDLEKTTTLRAHLDDDNQLHLWTGQHHPLPSQVAVYDLLGRKLVEKQIYITHTTLQLPATQQMVLVKFGGESVLVK